MESCQRCVDTLGSRFGPVSIGEWRQGSARLLGSARKVFVPTQDVGNRMVRHFPELSPTIRDHPELPSSGESGVLDQTIDVLPKRPFERRIALIGSVGAIKGSQLVQETALALDVVDRDLELVVVGRTDRDDLFADVENVRVLGPYREEALLRTLEVLELSAVWFSSVVPETYSYTLSATMTARLPVIGFNFGAVAERAQAWPATHLMPIGDMFEPMSVARQLSEASRRLPSQLRESDVRWHPRIFDSLLRDYYELS